MLKVYIVDEMSVIRHGLASVLKTYAGYEIVGEAPNIEVGLSEIEELQPDIVVIDIYREGGGGVEAINQLQRKLPKVKVLVLTDSSDKESFFSSIKAGAKAYLLKASELAEIVDSIRLVSSGGAVVYGYGAAKMFDFTDQKNTSDDPLSPREKEVLRFVAKGQSNREIGMKCFISETTVKAHLRRISEKLDVKNRAEAVAIALDRGLLKDD